jgi:hypothetical protein
MKLNYKRDEITRAIAAYDSLALSRLMTSQPTIEEMKDRLPKSLLSIQPLQNQIGDEHDARIYRRRPGFNTLAEWITQPRCRGLDQAARSFCSGQRLD